ncbi:hypothetical protein SprV_0200826800 [Sparganum proliferum]
MKNFFAAVKAAYGPRAKGTSSLLTADKTTLLTQKTQILQRQAEHFRGVLNRSSTICDDAIAHLPQVETNTTSTSCPLYTKPSRPYSSSPVGKLPKSQCGFRRHCGIIDMTFAVRQLQKRRQEELIHLYLRGSEESLRHGESRKAVENQNKIWLSRAIHPDGASALRWHDGSRHGQ